MLRRVHRSHTHITITLCYCIAFDAFIAATYIYIYIYIYILRCSIVRANAADGHSRRVQGKQVNHAERMLHSWRRVTSPDNVRCSIRGPERVHGSLRNFSAS
jgi:hypothetical protein